MNENPYLSPSFQDHPSLVTPSKLEVASRLKRFLNSVVDGIVARVIQAMVGVALAIVLGVMDSEELLDDPWFNVMLILANVTIFLGYFLFMEALFQRTVGKMVTGTLVVTNDGRKPSFGQCLGRTFARLIPFEAFSFLGSTNPVGWHDSLAKTKVVLKQ